MKARSSAASASADAPQSRCRNVALTSEGSYFAMSFGPSDGVVALIRRFAEDFYFAVLGHSEAASRVALATHELLENACRYCSSPEIAIRGSITRATRGFHVTIRTRNSASPQHGESVRARIAALAAATDPTAHYQSLLVSSTGTSGGAALGLARVRAEAEMLLTCELEGSEVTVVASGTIVIAKRR